MGFLRATAFASIAVFSLGLGLGALAGPVQAYEPPADDYVPYEPSGFFVFNWSGAYVGGNLGAGFVSAESTEVIFPDSLELFDSLNYDNYETTVMGGVQAGWQKHWGKLVLGGEIGFSLLRFDNTSESPLIDGLDRTAEVRDIFTFTGRVGYADGRWLAYFKGGLASAEVNVSYHDTIFGDRTSSSGREVGWTAGAGVDYALTQNLFLGIEYNYLHFNADVEPPFIPDIPAEFDNVDVDIQNIVVRLNYRFGGPCCMGGP